MTAEYPNVTCIILDIEGTVCPISFVKNQLFPYFLQQLPETLAGVSFPLNSASDDPVVKILYGFLADVRVSSEVLEAHITGLVSNDVKDATLKSLQGYVWQTGYDNGSIIAPLFTDAVHAIKTWTADKRVYIYSSGSVPAQKLLFLHVAATNEEGQEDLTPYLSGYYDITTSGHKQEKSSYENIIKHIGVKGSNALFLSDNVNEVRAAIAAGLRASIVIKPGNYDLTEEEKASYPIVRDFDELKL
ncbi:hypothetical protein BABINDRAFT_168746 [Babjeviella inositovora NRRL Y-12698]|uniref:Enolase-phosphatase E1 n=1 Tax=Babjeviella inositovora NRRL Y-12698 TaxID=984486 RepID=A0A1E3QJB4_9ASCO|nr:uncharacterized protein BABINDRAFT_168746 [Babjeviella inositovora NRRL Y-12698]ODQ77785.1 hypothetical protein BABINDRAFT_168746 [Babjeviella inositovora NRRL Y-12698]